MITKFLNWSAVHNKDYSSFDELSYRFLQYQKKDQELEEIRRNHPDAIFSVGHNVFSDRTEEEMWKRLSILPEPVHSL